MHLLYGLKEMVSEARQRSAAEESVWAVFYRWDDTAAFVQALKASGATVTRHETAGMPPLDVCHVYKAHR